jgi:Leucine-rich repeat (LRR) protein
MVYDTPVSKIPENLGTFNNLMSLVFKNCSLTYFPTIGDLEKLWDLDLSNNHLSHLDEIPGVQFLDLEDNLFNYIPMTKKGEKLRFLTMSRNPLKTIGSILFYNNLEGIYFQNTMLTSIPPGIDKLQKLLEIDLSNNKLSHLPTNILNLPHLEHLDIRQNLLSPNNIESIRKEFKKSHPKLELDI